MVREYIRNQDERDKYFDQQKHEILDTMRECFRVLSPEGIASHQVDLKDHLGGSLNNLRFSERIWESEFFVHSGFYTNRIRFQE